MRVPVRRQPDTRVSDRQLGFQRAGPGIDLSPIAGVIEGFRDQLVDEQRQRQQFDLNKRFLKEVNELQTDFETRKRDPNINPMEFVNTTDTVYSERHQALVEGLSKEGFDRDLLESFDLKLGTTRQAIYEKGLTHQIGVLRDRAFNEADDLGVSASQYVSSDPDGYVSAKEMVDETISNMPDLTEPEKEAKRDQIYGILRDTGSKTLAITKPEYVIQLLDPDNLTAPVRSSTTASTGPVSVQGLDADRTTVATVLSQELPPVVVAGFLGNFDVEAGYTGAQGDGGSASGIAQWRKERRDNFKEQFGKDPHEASKEEQARFVLWEMQNPAAAGMTAQQRDAILKAATAEEAAELIDKFYERSSGVHRTQRIESATKYAGSIVREGASMIGASQLGSDVEVIDLPASQADQVEPLPAVEERDINFKTGNPIIDDLNGPERLQLLAWAREQNNKVIASRKAEMDVIIGNVTAEALNNGGEIATPLPTQQDVLNVYGPIEGPQRWAQIQQSKDTGQAMQTFRTQSPEDIQRALSAIAPKPGSATYETELRIYQSAERAAAAVLEEREKDPAAYALKHFPAVAAAAEQGTAQYYAALDRAYETLGIEARYAPVLPEQAIERLVQDYKTMTPSQRRDYMRNNFSEMGEDRFARHVASMEGTTAQDDARVFALLRTYPGAPGEWANVFHQVLEGREVMHKDPVRRPAPELINAQFRAEGLSAINNLNAEASRAIQETAAALYVAKGGDPKALNVSLYRESLTTALGGSLPYNDKKGEVKDYTILPPKINGNEFEAWKDRLSFERITKMSVERRPPRYGDLKTPVPIEEIIDNGVFVMTSPGRYMIKMANDGRPLMTSTGKPFLVNIRSGDVK